MNTNKKTYITPAVKEYEMGTLSVFAGSAALQKAAARRVIEQENQTIWTPSSSN